MKPEPRHREVALGLVPGHVAGCFQHVPDGLGRCCSLSKLRVAIATALAAAEDRGRQQGRAEGACRCAETFEQILSNRNKAIISPRAATDTCRAIQADYRAAYERQPDQPPPEPEP